MSGSMQWLVTGECAQHFSAVYIQSQCHHRLELHLCQIWGKEPTSSEEEYFYQIPHLALCPQYSEKDFLKQGGMRLSAGWFVSV